MTTHLTYCSNYIDQYLRMVGILIDNINFFVCIYLLILCFTFFDSYKIIQNYTSN